MKFNSRIATIFFLAGLPLVCASCSRTADMHCYGGCDCNTCGASCGNGDYWYPFACGCFYLGDKKPVGDDCYTLGICGFDCNRCGCAKDDSVTVSDKFDFKTEAAVRGTDYTVDKIYSVSSDGSTNGIDGDNSFGEALMTFALNLQDIDNYGMDFEFIFEFTNYVPLADFVANVDMETSFNKHLKTSAKIDGYIPAGKHYLMASYRYEYQFLLQDGVPQTARFSCSANKILS